MDGQIKSGWLTDVLSTFTLLGNATNATLFLTLNSFTGELGFLTGLLTGSSRLNANIDIKALPNFGGSQQVYSGNITFTKKLFFLININTTITNESYTSPANTLSYDYFPGGVFSTGIQSSTQNESNVLYNLDVTVNSDPDFSFVPTVSALDIGKGDVNLNSNDFLKSYGADSPPASPKDTPFINFISSYRDTPFIINSFEQPNGSFVTINNLNQKHLDLFLTNGDWLAKEIEGEDLSDNVIDCSFICEIVSLSGSENICSSQEEVYSLNVPSNVDVSWSVSGGLTIESESNDSVTITAQGNGTGFLQAEIESSCNPNFSIEKEISFGSPSITAEGYYYNSSPTYPISPYYSIPNNPVSETPATVTANFSFNGTSSNAQIISQSDPSITWGVIPGSDQLSFYFDFYGSPDPWNPQSQTIVWRVTAESPCGTETYDVAFYSEVDNYNYAYYPNPASSEITIENTSYNNSKGSFTLSSNDSKGSIVIYNFNGAVVQTEEYDLNSQSFNLDVSKLKPGKYFMKIGAAREEETHQIVIRR